MSPKTNEERDVARYGHFGSWLRVERRKKFPSAEKFSEALADLGAPEASAKAVGHWEARRIRPRRSRTVKAIAAALGETYDNVIGFIKLDEQDEVTLARREAAGMADELAEARAEAVHLRQQLQNERAIAERRVREASRLTPEEERLVQELREVERGNDGREITSGLFALLAVSPKRSFEEMPACPERADAASALWRALEAFRAIPDHRARRLLLDALASGAAACVFTPPFAEAVKERPLVLTRGEEGEPYLPDLGD